MERDNYNILTDEELVKMAQEGSVTAEEFLINKYKELAKTNPACTLSWAETGKM